MALFDRLFRHTAAKGGALPPAPPPANFPTLFDLRQGMMDETGHIVLDVYSCNRPNYVVYRTDQRVAVQYADVPRDSAGPRKMMAALTPMLGEINGLIDGWRTKGQRSRAQHRAKRFDVRVADAMVAALEGDAPNAMLLLSKIKQDILDERTAWARLLYLGAALLTGVVFGLIALLLVKHAFTLPSVASDLFLAASAGLIGAFFSIALAIRGRTVLPDLQWVDNSVDAVLRMVVGYIGAGVLIAMVDAHMVNVSFGLPIGSSTGAATTTASPKTLLALSGTPSLKEAAAAMAAPDPKVPDQGQPDRDDAARAAVQQAVEVQEVDEQQRGGRLEMAWLQTLIFGFVAGFSERFVPDLLAKAGATAPDPLPKVSIAPTGAGNAQATKKPDEPNEAEEVDSETDHSDDEESHDDNCACNQPIGDAEGTADEHLPAASGGVAQATAT